MINIYTNTKKNYSSGFTLLETMVAISILAISIAGVSGLLASSLRLVNEYKDSLTAGMLAQEGIELIRYKRDSNKINSADWMLGLLTAPAPRCNTPNGCVAEISLSTGVVTFNHCSASCPVLKFDPSSGVYGYAIGSNTKFTRTITMTKPSTQDVQVTVTVSWQGPASTKSITVQEILRDWQ